MCNQDQETCNNLEKLHRLEMLIALEVKRLCEKHSINYFLTAGTLLGAVRHGGFIPWDDDMDFGMLREDYDKFIHVCGNELSDKFFLQTWDTEESFPFSYAKIRLNGTHVYEDFSKSGKMHDGIFIDIFPFDNVPSIKWKSKIQSKRYFFCKRILWMKKGLGNNMKSSRAKKIKYDISYLLLKLVSYNFTKKYFKRTLKKYNQIETNYVVADGSYSYSKETIPKEWTKSLIKVKFENEEFLSYKEYKKYLSHFYGNYMELPPVEKRKSHININVDFGIYM